MKRDSTTADRRTGRTGRAVAFVAALLAVCVAVVASSIAGSLPLSVGIVLLVIGGAATLLQRLTSAG
jgi:fatty acid desaturase